MGFRPHFQERADEFRLDALVSLGEFLAVTEVPTLVDHPELHFNASIHGKCRDGTPNRRRAPYQ
jgi:hypothetical protein